MWQGFQWCCNGTTGDVMLESVIGISASLSKSRLRQQYKYKSATGTGSDRGSDTDLDCGGRYVMNLVNIRVQVVDTVVQI